MRSFVVVCTIAELFASPLRYYEVVDLFRRLILLGAPVVLPHGGFRAFTSCVLAFVFLFIHEELSPYAAPKLNSLATSAHAVIFIVFAAGLVLKVHIFNYSGWALGFSLLAMSLLVIVIASIHEIDEAMQHAKVLKALGFWSRLTPVQKVSSTLTKSASLLSSSSSDGFLRGSVLLKGSVLHSMGRMTKVASSFNMPEESDTAVRCHLCHTRF